jgi:hypothetical protein
MRMLHSVINDSLTQNNTISRLADLSSSAGRSAALVQSSSFHHSKQTRTCPATCKWRLHKLPVKRADHE